MALPATKSEISQNPSKMGVTVAASGKELEADLQRKVKLWGVIEAFRDGSVLLSVAMYETQVPLTPCTQPNARQQAG